MAVQRDEAFQAGYPCGRPPVEIRWHRATLPNGQGEEEGHACHDGADYHDLLDQEDNGQDNRE